MSLALYARLDYLTKLYFVVLVNGINLSHIIKFIIFTKSTYDMGKKEELIHFASYTKRLFIFLQKFKYIFCSVDVQYRKKQQSTNATNRKKAVYKSFEIKIVLARVCKKFCVCICVNMCMCVFCRRGSSKKEKESKFSFVIAYQQNGSVSTKNICKLQ